MAQDKKKPDRSALESRIFEGFANTSRRRYFYICNMEDNLSRWSKNAVEDFGLPGEYMEDAGSVWGQLIHPNDRELYLKDIDDIFAGRKTRHDLDYRVCNKDGEYVICTCHGHVMKGEEGEVDLFIGTITNHGIMDNVDAATNLYNIYEFWAKMGEWKNKNEKMTILLVGVNNFSEINDTYGYDFGNKVLRGIGSLIRQTVGGKGSVFRMDGIQFACCVAMDSKDAVEKLYKELQIELKNNLYVDGIRISLTISGGALICNEKYDEFSAHTSVRYALGQSKHKYHSELVFFEQESLWDNRKNLELMNEIRNSILNNYEGFYLCYQPIMDAKKETLIGAEALLRWKKEPFGEVPPGVFIPWLENDPSFWDLGNWILKRALTQGKPILEKYPDFVLNVNIAYPQLARFKFREVVENLLEEIDFPAENLCLEITERCRQLEKEYLQEAVDYLKSLGIKIAIDDFGTGFSALNLLGELPVDTLKIDRGFTKDIQTNVSNQAIVKAVTGCAEDLDVHVCLEGMENRDMIDFVKQYSIYSYQGFHFSRPIPMEQFIEKYM